MNPAGECDVGTRDARFNYNRARPTGTAKLPWYQAQRNDPCPCGSGRKFKVCCQDRPPAPRAESELAKLAGQ